MTGTSNSFSVCLLVSALCFAGAHIALAQQNETLAQQNEPPIASRILKVGTKESPPFAIKNADGSWSGLSIDLWTHLCDELNLEFQLEESTLDEMLAKLETGQYDASVAAISVTSKRHERVDFCHPHFSTGLGIAVSSSERTTVWSLFRRVVTGKLLLLLASMLVIVVVCGFLFWLFERNLNKSMFGGERRSGIGMGVWWSTIMLLGHKGIIPVSVRGRILATLPMLASLVVLSIITGVITSILTVQQLDLGISRPTDLHCVRVATVASSTSEEYLQQRRIGFRPYATLRDAIRAVDDDEADAVVYDAALLKFLASEEYTNQIDVLPTLFNIQEYAIALPLDSSLRKSINEELLRYRESDAWDQLRYRYLGE